MADMEIEINITMGLREVSCEIARWLKVADGRVQ
jgi:hypothetical protein